MQSDSSTSVTQELTLYPIPWDGEDDEPLEIVELFSEPEKEIERELLQKTTLLFRAAHAYQKSSAPVEEMGIVQWLRKTAKKKIISDLATELLLRRESLASMGVREEVHALRSRISEITKRLNQKKESLSQRIEALSNHATSDIQNWRMEVATADELQVRMDRVLAISYQDRSQRIHLTKECRVLEKQVVSLLKVMCAFSWATEAQARLPIEPDALCDTLLTPKGSLGLSPNRGILENFEEGRPPFALTTDILQPSETMRASAGRMALEDSNRSLRGLQESLQFHAAGLAERFKAETIKEEVIRLSPRSRSSSPE